MRVPPEEVSVHLGSYLGGESGQPGHVEAPGTKGPRGGSSKRAGRNVSESRAGLERAVVDADSALTGGRLPRRGEAPTRAPMAVHRGSGSGTGGRFSGATWEARSGAGLRPRRHVWWRSGRESERLAVPWKPGNAGGGKGPHFRMLSKETKARDWRRPGNPSRAWRLPRKLDAVAKVVGARGTHPAVDVEAVGRRVRPVGEPDAGNPHVRFDERSQETERWSGTRHR